MADFKGTILTNSGRNLLAKALTGAPLHFTKLQLGDGIWSQNTIPENLTSLLSPKMDIPIQELNLKGDGTALIRGILTNTGLSEGFSTRELGIYAQDPDLGEILYAVAYAQNPDFIPSDGVVKVEEVIDVYTVVSNAQNVTAQISDTVVLATKQDVDDKISTHNKDPNAHDGLINADSVDGFDASISPAVNTVIARENDNGEFQIKDRATGIVYRVFVENGSLKLEVV